MCNIYDTREWSLRVILQTVPMDRPSADSYGEDTVPLNYVLTGSNIIIPDSGSGYEEFYIKWEIEDYANNITEHIQTIRITDNIGPDISGITTDVTGVNQNAQTSANITVSTPTTVSDNVSLNSDINLQYQVFDQSGNTIVDWTDTTPDSTVTVTVDYPDSYSLAGGTIEYTVKWRATDQAKNTTTSTTTTTVSVEFTFDTERPQLFSTPSSLVCRQQVAIQLRLLWILTTRRGRRAIPTLLRRTTCPPARPYNGQGPKRLHINTSG